MARKKKKFKARIPMLFIIFGVSIGVMYYQTNEDGGLLVMAGGMVLAFLVWIAQLVGGMFTAGSGKSGRGKSSGSRSTHEDHDGLFEGDGDHVDGDDGGDG